MRKMELFSILFMYLMKGELIEMTVILNGTSLLVLIILIVCLTLIFENVICIKLKRKKRR